jgi:hypothetical protein
MLIYKMNLLGDFKSVASGTQGWLLGEWNNRVIQLSVFSSIVFYVLSSYKLIDEVEKILTKFLNMKVGKEGTRIVHAVIFGFFMYVATRFILDPVARKLSNGVIEGNTDGGNTDGGKNEPAQREPAQREPAQREPAQREPAQREPAQRESARGSQEGSQERGK